jgi:hypothetical protein
LKARADPNLVEAGSEALLMKLAATRDIDVIRFLVSVAADV